MFTWKRYTLYIHTAWGMRYSPIKASSIGEAEGIARQCVRDVRTATRRPAYLIDIKRGWFADGDEPEPRQATP